MKPLSVYLCDPSLFTAPYDAALIRALHQKGIAPVLFTRPLRRPDELDLPDNMVRSWFYRDIEGLCGNAANRRWKKAISHWSDLARFEKEIYAAAPDVVHFQWSVAPLMDRGAIARISKRTPTILTVHDTTPFNGTPSSRLQALGFQNCLQAFTHLIVHTRSGEARLREFGIPESRISVIPHGPLHVKAKPPNLVKRQNGRWTIVAFGKLRPYKGLDVLLDAVAQLDALSRRKLRVIIAGEPLMPTEPLFEQIRQGNLADVVEFRLHHHSDEQMACLLSEADAFVFPYREIEASGVLFLIQDSNAWVIASQIGAFSEVIQPGVNGDLTPPGDAQALAQILKRGADARPVPSVPLAVASWDSIADQTTALYGALASKRTLAAA